MPIQDTSSYSLCMSFNHLSQTLSMPSSFSPWWTTYTSLDQTSFFLISVPLHMPILLTVMLFPSLPAWWKPFLGTSALQLPLPFLWSFLPLPDRASYTLSFLSFHSTLCWLIFLVLLTLWQSVRVLEPSNQGPSWRLCALQGSSESTSSYTLPWF